MEDRVFIERLKIVFLVDNVVMILFSYQVHFKLEVWFCVDDRRLVNKWLFWTIILMKNFVHFEIEGNIWLLDSMINLKMNDHYQQYILVFVFLEISDKQPYMIEYHILDELVLGFIFSFIWFTLKSKCRMWKTIEDYLLKESFWLSIISHIWLIL
jgi:hypothetical protein